MSDPQLADGILTALAETERLARRPTVRSDQLLALLDAGLEDVRSERSAPDMQGVVRSTRRFVAGDVVLAAAGRVQRGMPAAPDAGGES